jgi:hypothetical protein
MGVEKEVCCKGTKAAEVINSKWDEGNVLGIKG